MPRAEEAVGMCAEKQRVFVVGASGQARVVIDILEKQNRYVIAGLLDSFKPVHTRLCGYEVKGSENDLPSLTKEYETALGVVAIGDNVLRSEVVRRLRKSFPAFGFVTPIHPSAQIGRDVMLGDGTVVMAGAIINPGAVIGAHCIVNTNASVDHDSWLGDYGSMGPGATTGGNVRIGEFTAVAQRASIIHGLCIGEHAVIGAGATVLTDIPSFVVAHGTPARVSRKRTAGEAYL